MRGVVEWVVEPRRKRERSDGVSETMQHGYCLRIRVVGPKKYFGKNGRSRLYEGENETYIEASVENSSSILYDKEIRNKPRTRRTKRNV